MAAAAAAPRKRIARPTTTATAMMKSDAAECSSSTASSAERFVFKVRRLSAACSVLQRGREKTSERGRKNTERKETDLLSFLFISQPDPIFIRTKTKQNAQTSLAALAAAPPNLLFALASHADEAAAIDASAATTGAGAATGGFTVTPLEILLVLAPVAFYALLSAYRALVNPKASIGDGLFIVAALVIVANIVSILAFHKRIY